MGAQQFEEWLEKEYPISWNEAYLIGVGAKIKGLSRKCNLSEYDEKFCHNGTPLKVWQDAWYQGYDFKEIVKWEPHMAIL